MFVLPKDDMMMHPGLKYWIVFVLILTFTKSASGQTAIEGIVRDTSRQCISHVSIRSSIDSALTDDEGHFFITVTAGDTLLITRFGYQPVALLIPKSTPSAPFRITLFAIDSVGNSRIPPTIESLKNELLALQPDDYSYIKKAVDEAMPPQQSGITIKYPVLKPYPGVKIVFIGPAIYIGIDIYELYDHINKVRKHHAPGDGNTIPVMK